MSSLPYTTAIFQRLYEFVAPVLPLELKQDMKHALEHVMTDSTLTKEDIEETMIVFGKKVWPYRKALEEAIAHQEGIIGKTFLRTKFDRKLQKKIDEFFSQQGSFRDLYEGKIVLLFSPDERVQITEALVDMRAELIAYALQTIKGTGRPAFEDAVASFTELLASLEAELGDIRAMADDTQEHPLLAREMREHIRGFEQGLVLLGKEYAPDMLQRLGEHASGRRRTLTVRQIDTRTWEI